MFISTAQEGRPTFSVVIPCWNAERTIAETLTSVQNQTFANFEIILVDDGSTDGSAAILDQWSRGEARLKVIRVANGGPSRARNHAVFEHARGEFLAFLDSDDLWLPEKLQIVADAFQADAGLDGVYGRTVFFRDRPDAAVTVSKVSGAPLTPKSLLRGNATCTMSNVVVRADAFRASGGFDPSIVYSEDLEWLVRFTAAGRRICAIDKALTFYRSSDGGLSINFEKMHAGWRSAATSAQTAGYRLAPAALLAAEAVHLRFLARRALRSQGPRFTALKLAVRGALLSPTGFFGNPVHGLLTLMAAIVEGMLPTGLRLALQF